MTAHPTLLKRYAQIVCVLSFLLCLLFGSVAAYGGWHILHPTVTTQDEFTYERASSLGFWLGIRDGDKHVFEKLGKEEFDAKKPYYFNIARTDYAPRVAQITLQMFVYMLLFSMVFFKHRQILKRLKGTP